MPSFFDGWLSGSCSATTAGPEDHERAFDVLAADAHQVTRRGGVRLVDLALVAALDQALLRHGRAAAGRDDQDGVGIGRHELQRLAASRWCRCARSARSSTSLMPAFSACGVMSLSQRLAVGVGVAEEAERLDAGASSCARPSGCAITSVDCGRRNDQSSLPGGRPAGESTSCGVLPSAETSAIANGDRRRSRADDDVGLVLGDEAAACSARPWSGRSRRRGR